MTTKLSSNATPSERSKSQGRPEGPRRVAGSWPPEISITRINWNNACGIGRAGLLASGTGSGLCRVDYMRGVRVEDPRMVKVRAKLAGGTDEADDVDADEMDVEG